MLTNSTPDKIALVSSESMLSIYKGLPEDMQEIANTFLHKRSILSLKEGKWHNMHSFIEVLKEIENFYGPATLYEVGKKVIESSIKDGQAKDLEEAFENCENNYLINHKNSQCRLNIIEFKTRKRRIVLTLNNPYPFEMNRGMLASICRKHPPKKNCIADVTIDSNSEFPLGIYIISY